MANQEYEKLFQDFPPVTTEEWEAVIEKDLKGADYEKKLVFKTLEGIKLQPYYRAEHLPKDAELQALPGEYPFVRGNNANRNDWEIREDIEVSDVKMANAKAKLFIERGVTSIGFSCCTGNCQCAILKMEDFVALLEGINPELVSINFSCGCNAQQIVENLIQWTQVNKFDVKKVKGVISFNPLGKLSRTGSWYKTESEDFEQAIQLLRLAAEKLPSYRVINICGYGFSLAGASAVQELAYTLAMASEYLDKITEAGLSADMVAAQLQMSIGVGSGYFIEIAKFRAARVLWSRMMNAYNAKADSSKVFLHATTTMWNNTVYDPHVNILRTTTEAMSATLGNVDSLNVKPFDASYTESTALAERVARNIQIILKEEAYFNKIVDPGAGSYYIENITKSLIDAAWKEFTDIEEKGGYLGQLKVGAIQKALEATANSRMQKIAQRRETLLGTNQFPNPLEKVATKITKAKAFQTPAGKGDVEPIKLMRGAEAFEQLRLATEESNKQPKVFLFTIGNPVMRKARAGFASSFFACAGYEIIDNIGFKSVDEGVEAALKAQSNIVVVCSSDEEYAELVPSISDKLSGKATVVVAGAPACTDELKAKGIEHFIHMKSNVLETLQAFNKILGIQ